MDIVEPGRNFPQFPIRLDVNIEISIRFFPPPLPPPPVRVVVTFLFFPSSSRSLFFLPPSSPSSNIEFDQPSVRSTIVESNAFDRSFRPSPRRTKVDTVGAWSDTFDRFSTFRSFPFFHTRSERIERNLTKMAILGRHANRTESYIYILFFVSSRRRSIERKIFDNEKTSVVEKLIS